MMCGSMSQDTHSSGVQPATPQLDSVIRLFSHCVAFDAELRLVHIAEQTAKTLGLDVTAAAGHRLDQLLGKAAATRLRAALTELGELPVGAVIEGPSGALELGWVRLDGEAPLLVGLAASRLPGLAAVGSGLAHGASSGAPETLGPSTVEQLAVQLAVGEVDEIAYLIDDDYRVRMIDGAGAEQQRCCYEVMHNRRQSCEGCLVEVVKRTGRPAWRERQRGQRRQRVTLYPVGEGEQRQLLEVVRDVTREAELEERLVQADRLSALGELVAGVAHEVNNPNGVIQGNLRIVAEAMEDLLVLADARAVGRPDYQIARLPYGYFRERVGQLIADMQESSERIEGIVRDLRHFAVRGDGQRSESVCLNQVVRRALRLVERRLRRSADVELSLASELSVLQGSGQKLEQVLVNLLLNAVHAIEEQRWPVAEREAQAGLLPSRGQITIRTTMTDHALELEVRDDGVGIDDRVRRRLFDPFFSTRRAQGGTGLGLSIAFGIVSEHGGKIEVDSVPGEGSVFRLAFPRVAAAGGESIADDEAQDRQSTETSI
jgi:signal transduction histidine kinase